MSSLTFDIPAPRAHWPRWYQWLSVAHRDALGLFPESAYEQLRVDHVVLGKRFVVLSDPDAVAHICGSANKRYRLANLHLRMLEPALGTGLVVAQEKSWSLQRRHAFKLMPVEHEAPIQGFIERRIDQTLQAWESRAIPSTQLINELVALAIDLISISVFKHCEPVAHADILRSIDAHRRNIEKMDVMDALGLPAWIYSPRMMRARSIGHAIDAEIEATIRRARAKAEQGGASASASPTQLSRDFVLSLITGFESVATSSLWALGILASNPALQEATNVTPACPHLVSRKLPANAAAMDATVLEALRLFPPLPFIFRQAIDDDTTPAGRIQKGTLICMSPWLIHRHRALWSNPDSFDPTRFAESSKLPDAFIPFGVGARRCVGMATGYNLIKQIVQRAAQKYVMTRDNAALPHPRGGVSLRPGSAFEIRFARRPAVFAR